MRGLPRAQLYSRKAENRPPSRKVVRVVGMRRTAATAACSQANRKKGRCGCFRRGCCDLLLLLVLLALLLLVVLAAFGCCCCAGLAPEGEG